MNREERLKRLNSSDSILSRASQGFIEPGEVKLGIGYNNIVIGDGNLRSNQKIPTDPGFSFSREGSRLKVGRNLRFDKDFKQILFDNGSQMLQPVGDILASTTANPLPMIRPTLSEQVSWVFSPSGMKMLNFVRNTLG